MLDFVYFVLITKYYKFSTNYRNFPQFLNEKRHRCHPPLHPQRPCDVSRGQYRYVTLRLLTISEFRKYWFLF